MQYSPKLKKAMEEIKSILKRNDIAGIVILHTIEGEATVTKESVHVSGFTEYLFNINTSYSAASIENERFKLKGKSIHYKSKEERDIKVAGAVNMLDHLSEWTGRLAMNVIDLSKKTNEMVEKIDDDDEGNHTTHSQQNN